MYFFGMVSLVGVNPFLAIPLAGLIAMISALPVMAVVFRLRAAYLAVGTWVVAEVFHRVAGRLPGFGLGTGISMPLFGRSRLRRRRIGKTGDNMDDDHAGHFQPSAYLPTWNLPRSRFGIGLTAVRDNEEAASALGVDLIGRHAWLFSAWTTLFTGMIGAITALQKMRISPQASFSFLDWTVFVIFIVVVGGTAA